MLRITTLIVGLFAAAVAGLFTATSAIADTCPSYQIGGIEQKAGQQWTITIDLDDDAYRATRGATRRTADITSTCSGRDIQIVQSNSSDGDDCTYDLRYVGTERIGATVTGTVTCSSGPVQLSSARLLALNYSGGGSFKLNDGRIMFVLQTADALAMRFSAIVVGLADREEVRNFAQTMLDDHKDLNTQIEQLVQASNIKLRKSALSLALENSGTEKRTDIVKRVGPAVDRKYVETEVGFHQRMVATFDDRLIPGAKAEEVKQFLQDARKVFTRHEHHAIETAKILGIPASVWSAKVWPFCQPNSTC